MIAPCLAIHVAILTFVVLVAFPDAGHYLFGDFGLVESREPGFAAYLGRSILLLGLCVGWSRAILTYHPSAPNVRWLKVSGVSSFLLWVVLLVA
jgi:hypothetical protein